MIVRRAAASAEDTLLEARAAAEAAKLELEAAKLRAEAEELETAAVAERRRSTARRLLNGSAAIGAATLKRRLKEELELDITDEGLNSLFEAVGRNPDSAVMYFEDLAGETFSKSLEAAAAAARAEQRRLQLEEQERARKEAEAARKRRAEEADVMAAVSMEDFEENDDRGVATRLLACLAYLLPLTDALQFGLPLVDFVPDLIPFFVNLTSLNQLINAIPFGSLIIFIMLTALANNRELPRLLRFNLQQAVLLDVFLFIPSILASLASLAFGNEGDVSEDIGLFVFVLLLGTVVYSVVCTLLLGQDPEGVPVVSDATKRGIDGPFQQ